MSGDVYCGKCGADRANSGPWGKDECCTACGAKTWRLRLDSPPETPKRVFTIGHSNKPFENLLERLGEHGVTNVIDVRSKPYSSYNPQFNGMELRERLPLREISYRWKGYTLGGMPEDPALRTGGRPDYAKMRRSELYQGGLMELLERDLPYPDNKGAVALMCSEQDPIGCHRRRLVGADLVEAGYELVHILGDGNLKTEYEIRERTGENEPSILELLNG